MHIPSNPTIQTQGDSMCVYISGNTAAEVCLLFCPISAPMCTGVQKPSQERVTWSFAILPPLHPVSNNVIEVIKKVIESNEQTRWDETACTCHKLNYHYRQLDPYGVMSVMARLRGGTLPSRLHCRPQTRAFLQSQYRCSMWRSWSRLFSTGHNYLSVVIITVN